MVANSSLFAGIATSFFFDISMYCNSCFIQFSQIADSFPGMEMPTVVPQGAVPQPIKLKNPPKWFPVTAGGSFAVRPCIDFSK